jgi:hypothetical protein
MIDPGRYEGTHGRSRIRGSCGETVSFTGRGEVAEQVRVGCNTLRDVIGAPNVADSARTSNEGHNVGIWTIFNG